ncbi:MAG: GNAT family N-acetyltransferase [Rhodospirillaceae bacterium]
MADSGPVCLSELAETAAAVAALTGIFFETSSRTDFSSPGERQGFLERWTGFYLTRYPDEVWFWRDADGVLAGYLTGCRDSAGAAPLFDAVPGYPVFEDCFGAFPAHLHVNCRADRQNRGIGARLVEHFTARCRAAGLAGVHIVTAPTARNVGFYQRTGFTHQVTRNFGSRSLLFMGRPLRAEGGA